MIPPTGRPSRPDVPGPSRSTQHCCHLDAAAPGSSSTAVASWPTRFAGGVSALPGCELLNDVVVNQVLFRFEDDEATNAVLARVQESGEAWMGGTVWDGRAAIRFSVSGWRTTEADIDRTVAAFESALVAA